MKIAIRSEGSTDMGVLNLDGSLEKGPMIILIEKLECYQNLCSELGCTEEYSFIEWVYIHKKDIENSSEKRKRVVLRGKKAQRDESIETTLLKGFYNNSEAFSSLAREKASDMAIFFVDVDKDSLTDRYAQVKLGLKKYGFCETGVPMIPDKISEAWLMCCLSKYEKCEEHEKATSDKTSPNYPKNVCEASGFTRHEIAENCDPNQINMPSFNQFREDFKGAINSYIGYKVCT